MSFSSEIKQELSKINNLKNKEALKYELLGYLLSNNPKIVAHSKIKYSTENEYNINRFSKLLSNLNIKHKIEMEGNLFVITLKIKDVNFIKIENGEIVASGNIVDEEVVASKNTINEENEQTKENKNRNENKVEDKKENKVENKKESKKEQKNGNKIENKKCIIRGAFLGAGSINNPEKKYHLEINFSNKKNLEYILQIMKELGITPKMLEGKNKYTIYLKEGEEISNLLALMGASKGMMNFEEIRVKREMRGKVNRIVNCQTANLSKTINASVEQIEAIRKLKETGQFNKLNDNLKEIATLRLENPNMNLIELGKLLKKPIGKSGVNYRLKKIIDIAKNS